MHNSSAVDCRENMPCELDVPLPSWEQWYYILVERYLSSSDVYFRIGVQVKGKTLEFIFCTIMKIKIILKIISLMNMK